MYVSPFFPLLSARPALRGAEAIGEGHFFFLFLKLILLAIIVLQCCVSFHCMEKWISHTHTYIPSLLDFLPIYGGSEGKRIHLKSCNAGDLGSVPGLGRPPGGWRDNPLQSSCLENPQGQRSLGGYSPWGCKQPDTTKWLSTAAQCIKWNFPCHPVLILVYNMDI